jgi:hypothetical protein
MFRLGAGGAALMQDMPGHRDSRPDEGNRTKNENTVQNSHRGQHNKWKRETVWGPKALVWFGRNWGGFWAEHGQNQKDETRGQTASGYRDEWAYEGALSLR